MFGFKSKDKVETTSWFSRLTTGLKKTRKLFGNRISDLLRGKRQLDAETREALETILLQADVGLDATQRILDTVTQKLSRQEVKDENAVMHMLKDELIEILRPYVKPIEITQKPYVILVVGINGSGKTTSIAKMAHYFQAQQHKVMLAAGDTFRAAAVEQLQVWGKRNDVVVIAQQSGADSASVIFDAVHASKARAVDVLLADTAGRLHTQQNLMAELEKIKRVIQKQYPEAPQQTVLVLDAGIGQNAIHQAEQFHQAIGITSIILTKLDGTAKGGIIFALVEKLKLPISFIGIGESVDDLKPFDAAQFVTALFE